MTSFVWSDGRFAVGVLAAVALAACNGAEPTASEALTEDSQVGISRQALVVTPDGCQIGDESLASYTRKCTAAMGGIDIPGFDCLSDNSVEVPETQISGGAYGTQTCDRPNALYGHCDPGSHFQVVVDKNNAAGQHVTIVAHCRKRGASSDQFTDVAMIAYNHTTGDTCFFQDADPSSPNPRVAPPPSNDQTKFWATPKDVAGMSCVGCHDNGPFIRSPYLTQLKGTPATESLSPELPEIVGAQIRAIINNPDSILPGSRDNGWNSTQPYRFVGSNFQGWKAYAVSLQGNQCTGCHRMGIASDEASGSRVWFKGGTSQTFSVVATGDNGAQSHKNPHTGTPGAPLTSPIWMLPSQEKFVQSTLDSAEAIQKCAQTLTSNQTMAKCGYAQFAHGNTCAGPSLVVTVNGGTKGPTTTDPHVDVVDIPAGGNVAFGGYIELHGPFREKSTNVPWYNAGFDGSGAQLIVTGTPAHYQAQAGWWGPPSPTPRAGAGGTLAFTAFAEVDAVLDPNKCFYTPTPLVDLTGTVFSSKATIDTNLSKLDVPTSFIGNLSLILEKDFYGTKENLANTLLMRQVSKAGAFEGASFGYGCTGWTPQYSVKHKATTSDVELIAAPNAKKHRCFLTGLSGDWTTENQPFAKIYESGNSIRLQVSAAGGPTAVSAEASCVQIQP